MAAHDPAVVADLVNRADHETARAATAFDQQGDGRRACQERPVVGPEEPGAECGEEALVQRRQVQPGGPGDIVVPKGADDGLFQVVVRWRHLSIVRHVSHYCDTCRDPIAFPRWNRAGSPGHSSPNCSGCSPAAKDPQSPAELRDGLAEPVAYSTVTTVLARLRRKGLIRRESEGRGFVYSLIVDEAALVADRMRSDLLRSGDGRQVLQRFVSELDDAERSALQEVLDELGGH